jgi:NAD(P)-dependent dehydrogenase (short-subunit alcohol dehydrogenase family)
VGALDRRVALVTGAASGIGLATAQRFHAEGCIVVGFDAAEPASAMPGPMIQGDVRDEGDVARAVEHAVREHGRLDIVVNAAGVASGGPVHQLTLDEWNRAIGVNLTGTFLVCKHALGPMMRQRSGSIVTIASIEGIQGTEGGSGYNASKAGVVMLTKNLAIDYGRMGIRANTICPGFVETPMMASIMGMEAMAAVRDRYREEHKLGRFAQPAEIAAAALWLASDESSFVTGHTLVVDGGYTAGTRTELADLLGLK